MDTVLIAVLGVFIGSFINVLIDRLPVGETVLWGRSHCDHCKKVLRWFELIPVLSFVIQRGQCRRCRKRLSIQYPIVEILSSFLLVFLVFHTGNSLVSLIGYSLIAYSFLVIFIVDLKTQIIPDSMLLTSLIGIVFVFFLFSGTPYSLPIALASASGASVFFLFLWFVTRGRGMGLGDVKLAFVLGLWLGYPKIVVALYLAFLTGALVGVILMLTGNKTLKSTIAFGPFLIAGAMCAYRYGDQIMLLWRMLV